MYRKAEGRTLKRKGRRRDRLSSNHHMEKRAKGSGKKVKSLIGGNDGRMQGRRKVPREYRKRKW